MSFDGYHCQLTAPAKWYEYALAIIGFVLTINGILLFLRTNFNLGNALTLILGLVFLLYAKYFDWINKKLPKWIKSIFVLGLIIVLFFTSF